MATPAPELLLRAPLASRGIAVTLLGDFTVCIEGVLIDAARWKFKHPRLLWQMLCLAPGQRLSRDEAAEALWPQASVQASSNRLYHALHTLRSIFSDAGVADARQLIPMQGGTLWLDADRVIDVDVQRFMQAAAAARACGDGDAVWGHLEHASALHRGPFAVPATAGAWFEPHREALLRQRVWVLEQRLQRLRADHRLEDAIDAGQALVQAEPSNEAAHRLLIELYQAQNRPDLAAQQYTACSRLLRRELRIEPSPATRQLADSITEQASRRRAQQAQAATVPGATAATSAAQRFTAPTRATPLLGRDSELAELQQWLLQEEGPRLITIAAAGGIGKTRLAAALAEQVQDHFADGVSFIALGDVQRPSRLAEHLCQALALSSAEQPAEQVLSKALAARHMLLVLDRFEHLLEAAPQLAQWLQAAPRLRIVVTSQRTLTLRAEQAYALPALWVSSAPAAVELFVRTAALAGVRVEGPRHEALIRQVCQRLGGNALAIELAAAQLASVPLAALPEALQDPLPLLVGTSTDDEPQHASLQATIGWSVSLLAGGEARLLAMLSVFAGEFSAEDVRAVFGAGLDTVPLPMLRTLLDRHLLIGSIEPSEPNAPPEPRRFAMPDAVRDFARQQARADPAWPQLQSAHALHFAQAARQAWEAVQKGQTGLAHPIFRAAAVDIVQARQWMRQHTPTEAYLRLCWQHAVLQLTFGAVREAIEGLQDVVQVPVREHNEREQSAWCHYLLSRALAWGGDYAAAIKPLRKARRLAKGSTDDVLEERIARYLASLWISQLRIDEALKLLEGVIEKSQRLGRDDWLASHYLMLAACFEARCQHARAIAAAELALDCANRAQHPHSSLLAVLSLANIDTVRGELPLAEEGLRESRLLSEVAYSPVLMIHLSLGLGVLAFERLRLAEGGQHFEQALALCQTHLAGRAIVPSLWQEFVLMETGRADEVRLLRRLSEQELPFDTDFSVTYVRARGYRLQLQAQAGDGPGVEATGAGLLVLARRAGNALWASWLAEAAAVAAHGVRQPKLAASLLEQSKRLQANHGIVATPRQAASWARVAALARETPAMHSAEQGQDEGAQLTRYLESLLTELSRWPGALRVDALLDRLSRVLPAPTATG
jgi:DNA-binding SARP family transcriptional activator/predicted ATPase